jgi:argininosuccinate lyase
MTVARGGRLSQSIDLAMERLNTSVDVDRELWREDIEGSIAHARGLARVKVISDSEAETLITGLERIAQEIERGEFDWRRDREDVHMNIEARLTEIVGPVGGKLHTGRSRNDQIATDLRLWCRRQGKKTLDEIRELALTLIERAESEIETLMPAYTHLLAPPHGLAGAARARLRPYVGRDRTHERVAAWRRRRRG